MRSWFVRFQAVRERSLLARSRTKAVVLWTTVGPPCVLRPVSRLAAAGAVVVVLVPASASAVPPLYHASVAPRADGSRRLVWKVPGGIKVLRDGAPWGRARLYSVPSTCSLRTVGRGYAAFACLDQPGRPGQAGYPGTPRIMSLATGFLSDIPGIPKPQECWADPILRVGRNILEFQSSTYQGEGTPYSLNWRTGQGVAGNDWNRDPRRLFDLDSRTGTRTLCRPGHGERHIAHTRTPSAKRAPSTTRHGLRRRT